MDQRVAVKYVASEKLPHYFTLRSPNAPMRDQEELTLLYILLWFSLVLPGKCRNSDSKEATVIFSPIVFNSPRSLC
jgi:hypothetical protein